MNKEHLRQLSYLLGGVMTIVLAFLFYDNRMFNLMHFYIAIGSVFLLIGIFDKWISKMFGKASLIVFVFEAATFFYASKTKLEVADDIVRATLQIAALVYVGLAIYLFMSRDNSSYKRRRRGKQRRRSRTAPPNPIAL